MTATQAIYLRKLLTDAGYDLHKESGDWIVGYSSYYRHEAAIYGGDVMVLALPEMAAMQLNLYENAAFVPIDHAPDGFPMGMALHESELLTWLKKSIKIPLEKPETLKTDVQALVMQRRGQDRLRDELMRYWGGRCAVTNVKTPDLLIASHIKPWAECDTSEEKLDPFNALLLNAALDKAFDKGLISFDDEGKILISPQWDTSEAGAMGILEDAKLRRIDDNHRRYLQYHRQNIWK
ncbi:HNH endonuclease [Hydrogenimonas cancrithermarum]|uniref:HNH nuclease domain-containing protein n=1 Tax=Hydrogenimonas cancrithermarum TaxID=2993563 RepID=A0ABN6WXI5_9BACT|nr:HNH endonuclease [Hydrogenimonas cancrithermarum]BDY14020.1 hypothetical protein HCR_23330 [Hydrogenimonas cancrithermarum]